MRPEIPKPRKVGLKMLPRKDLGVNVYEAARQRTKYVMENFDHVAIGFSGGKDSTAVLNIALEVAHEHPELARKHLPLRVIHFDEEAIPYETEEYVRRVATREDVTLEWYCVPVRHRNACSNAEPWWWPWAPEVREKWCRPMPPEAITEIPGLPTEPPEARLTIPEANNIWMPPSLGTCALLMGIRAAESLLRQRAVSRRRVDNFIVPYWGLSNLGNLSTVYPIYDWKTEDVWAAPARKGWDYNRAYDLMEMAGLPPSQQRCSPAFGEEPLQKFHVYASAFPEVWAKMCDRVPGVGAAYRLSQTELWGYKAVPPKPPGMPWPEFINHYVAKFRPQDVSHVALMIGRLIRRHYKVAAHPILESARHPISGVSWTFLQKIALRGDFKKRRSEVATGGVEMHNPRHWYRYADELAQIISDGRYGELAAPLAAPNDPYALIPPELRRDTT
jgi:predicted phosphoadenosine phosphosulfate sulfurtransferase